MKMSRNQLKALVKECLIELLSEGLGAGAMIAPSRPQAVDESRVHNNRSIQARRQRDRFDPALDTPIGKTAALKNAIKTSAGGNQLMESILADTAATTLQEQFSHGDVNPVPSGASVPVQPQQEQFAGRPEDVFGEESASKWAALAFMDVPGKKTTQV